MSKQRAKITFVVELNSLEITVPSQEAGQALVKKLNTGLRGAIKKALSLPKEAKLKDSFNGVISGRIEGSEDAGFVLVDFGSGDSDSDDSEDSEEDDSESSEENDQEKSEDTGVSRPSPTEDTQEEEGSDTESDGAEGSPTGSGKARKFKPRGKR